MIRKRIFALASALIVSFQLMLVFVVAAETEKKGKADYFNARNTYTTIIMQGNTPSASDCVAFENTLELTENGYTSFARYGWIENQSNLSPNAPIVTANQFKTMRAYDVAYYSGHGGMDDDPNVSGWELNPYLNFGATSEFNVAATLGVSASNWQTACAVTPSHSLRVIILACCSQLDDEIVKYYARIMKASGVRVIAGYHGTAPSNGDDTIATNFVMNCNSGSGVMDAWDTANDSHPWAVLVYNSNGNSDYRLPGFPGATYAAPVSTASIYRYKQGLGSTISLSTVPGSDTEIMDMIMSLPLSITTTPMSNSAMLQKYSRDTAWTDAIEDDDSEVRRTLSSALNASIDDAICVQYVVTQEEIDEETGVVPGSDIIVERTYQYYDTYNGIKIADSYISVSVDSRGINEILDQRRTTDAIVPSDLGETALFTNKTDLVAVSDALKRIHRDNAFLVHSELHKIALAYAPDGSGNYVLCYEFMFADGFRYVNVVTGKIICF